MCSDESGPQETVCFEFRGGHYPDQKCRAPILTHVTSALEFEWKSILRPIQSHSRAFRYIMALGLRSRLFLILREIRLKAISSENCNVTFGQVIL